MPGEFTVNCINAGESRARTLETLDKALAEGRAVGAERAEASRLAALNGSFSTVSFISANGHARFAVAQIDQNGDPGLNIVGNLANVG